jgi:peptidoglycan/xylan/chitin deacetylase (PgdA/CDA1 family)
MFNFKTLTIGFVILLIFFNVLSFFICPYHISFLTFFCLHAKIFYITLLLIIVILPVALSFFPCLEFHHKPVLCRGEVTEKEVALTFDDGPDPERTPEILNILDRYQIKATFFVIGKKIKGNEVLLRRIIQKGHSIGNHSFEHSNSWDFKSSGTLRKDIQMTNDLILEITGVTTNYFRPPYGVINPMVHNALKSFNYHVIAWSKRSFDTILKSDNKILRRTTKSLKPGDILLFHDTSEKTSLLLEQIILAIEKAGFKIVSLDKFINPN